MSFKDKRITELDELTAPVSGDYLPIVDVSDTAAGTTKKISFSTIGANVATNASNITSGTIPDARLSANVTVQGNVFNAANKLVQLDGSSKLPVADGSQLTGLTKTQVGLSSVPNTDCTNASNITSGTLPDARLSANITAQGNVFNAAGKLVQLDGASKYPALDGSQITNLSKTQVGLSSVPNVDCTDAGNITSGTLNDARLSTNVSLKIKTVTPVTLAGTYPVAINTNDSWYLTNHASGIVNFLLSNSLVPGIEVKIFTNTAQTVSFSTDSGITAMYVGGSVGPGGAYTPAAAAGRTINIHCVAAGLVFISGE